jgi:hypothetical protein
VWADDATAVVELTEALRTANGTQRLRPIQAVAIREALKCGGLLLNARVGAGKTLVAALLCTLFEDMRPLMIVPGGHNRSKADPLGKTGREIAAYREHWKISHNLQIVSYNDISRDVDERLLATYRPGAIICDEADKLRRVTASGCARRIAKYMSATPGTLFFSMSGTMWKEGVRDFAHLAAWALRNGSPLPLIPSEIDQWHNVLKGERGLAPKVAAQLGCSVEDIPGAFRERLTQTPGVIISTDQFTDVPLTLERVAIDAGTRRELMTLYTDGVTPDGWDALEDGQDESESGTGTWAQARRLALGFYHRPDPVPPKPWMLARRGYARLVTRMMSEFNTELQVRRWAEKEQHPTWIKWRDIQPTFTPNFVPVWLTDSALTYCAEWGQAGGIVWTDHRAFAARLAQETGWRWFAGGGVDGSGMPIESCTDSTIIASRQANGTGRNLQRWNRALITACPGSGRDVEQLLGRQHREGQSKPVEVSIMIGCITHAEDLDKAIALSQQEEIEMGRVSKISTCTWRE